MAGNLSFLLIITYNCIMVSNFYEGGIIYKNTLHCEVEFVAFSYLSYKNVFQGTLLVVCWLRLSASTQEGVGSIPGQGTKILHVLCLCGQKKIFQVIL